MQLARRSIGAVWYLFIFGWGWALEQTTIRLLAALLVVLYGIQIFKDIPGVKDGNSQHDLKEIWQVVRSILVLEKRHSSNILTAMRAYTETVNQLQTQAAEIEAKWRLNLHNHHKHTHIILRKKTIIIFFFWIWDHAGLQKPFYIRLAKEKSKDAQTVVTQYSDGWCAGSSNTRQVATSCIALYFPSLAIKQERKKRLNVII